MTKRGQGPWARVLDARLVVLRDDAGNPMWPTGRISIRFQNAIPGGASAYRYFACLHGLTDAVPNPYSDCQASFALGVGQDLFEKVEALNGLAGIRKAWAETISQYRKVH